MVDNLKFFLHAVLIPDTKEHTMTSSTSQATATRSTSSRGLLTRIGIALLAAVAGNLVLSQVLAAAVDADPDFLALQPGPVATASAVGVLLGAALFAILRRINRQRLFVPLVVVGALLSLAGPLGLLGATQESQPGVSDAAALALIPLHLLVAAVVAVVLPSRSR
jgi:peptidoglycan/LPS O-acetylase OafA/YrhL